MRASAVSIVRTSRFLDAPGQGRTILSPARLSRRTAWLSLVLLTGCGGSTDNLPRQAVSGTVTLDGKPLERGTISFQPDSGLPTAAAVAITAGSYSMARAQGLVPGAYKVLISSTPPAQVTIDPATGMPPPPGKPTPPPKELLAAKYNASSTLSAEVKEGTANRFDFALEGAAKK
jgi:hypothetical protein